MPPKGYSGVTIFSSRVCCGCCGMWYGSKVWHSTYKYRRVMCMLCRGIIFQQVFSYASGFFAIMYDLGAKTTRLLA